MSVKEIHGVCTNCSDRQLVKIYTEELIYCIHNTLLSIHAIRNCSNCYQRSVVINNTTVCDVCKITNDKKNKTPPPEPEQQKSKFYVDSLNCKGHWIVDEYCDAKCYDCNTVYCSCYSIAHCCCFGCDSNSDSKLLLDTLDSITTNLVWSSLFSQVTEADKLDATIMDIIYDKYENHIQTKQLHLEEMIGNTEIVELNDLLRQCIVFEIELRRQIRKDLNNYNMI